MHFLKVGVPILALALGLVSCASQSTTADNSSCKVHTGHNHAHNKTCGHKAVKHEDHMDYMHDGHKHAEHGDHVDDHQG